MNTGSTGVFGRNQNFGLHAGSLQRLKPTRRLVSAPSRSSSSFRVYAKLNPYKTLGVSPNASEKEIKRAHRKLVLKHHPDLAKGEEGIEVKFLAIQEAYEILIGRRRGKEDSERPAGWDFHDWYWSFSMKHRKGSRAAGAPPPDATRQNWRQQIAGLREKAAKKAGSAPRGRPGSTVHAKDARPCNPTEAASSSVWRSTTKNARKSNFVGRSEAAKEAFASENTPQQRLRAQARATSKAKAASVVEKEQQQTVASAASSMAASSKAAATAESVRTSGPANASAPSSTSAATAEQTAWRSLLTKAIQQVHDLRHRHETSVHTHAQKIQSHIVGLGEKFHRRLQAEAFSMFVPNLGDMPGLNEAHLRWRGMRGFHGGSSHGRGVPSENELHMLFGDAVRSMQEVEEAAVNASAAGAAGSYSYHVDNHSRKFADRGHVKSRLSNQLTGLKRRAAMKRDFEE